MIEVENVEKSYGSLRALQGVSLRIAPGETFGLLGLNGAGKSTLSRILMGLLRADQGRVSVLGIDPARDPVAVRAKLGYLAEESVLYDELTAREHLELVAALRGVPRDQARARSDRLLEFLDLAVAADRATGGYSRGMRRKTAIACALVGDPEAVLLDEPTDGLDPDGARRFAEVLAELKRRGKAIIVASHILPLIERRCDRVGILDRGKVVAQGTLAELRAQANEPEADLERLFLVLTKREEKDARGLLE
ncbi:MAG TPA: ABC transporter ATP-binding protein [Planctomycetota bacterium]|nr:ABC transporter ATP-binding protein [Planctomycetota bacterium]